MTKSGFRTDSGRLRSNNEDSYLVRPDEEVYAVADGVGGHNSGEVASRRAMKGLETCLENQSPADFHGKPDMAKDLMHYFMACLQEVNGEILAMSRTEPDNAGMATTAVIAHRYQDWLYIVNVGDSRAYLIREGRISQITEDHTYVNRLVQSGDLTRMEAREHPQKNIITRAVGAEPELDPDFFTVALQEADRIILCTDGLHGELSDQEICRITADGKDPDEICRQLISRANENGGRDNITVICLEIT